MKTPYEIETIIAQLGGRKIFAMAFNGSTYDLRDNPSLTLHVPAGLRRAAKCSHVRVTLMPSDTYKVEFISVSGCREKVRSFDDIYADGLKGLVEKETGLALSL